MGNENFAHNINQGQLDSVQWQDIMTTAAGIEPKHNFTIVKSTEGDWVGLYDNGILVSEGHTLKAEDVICYLAIPITTVEVDTTNLSTLPINLNDLPK